MYTSRRLVIYALHIIAQVSASTIFVSHNGLLNEETCGSSPHTACQNLQDTIKQAADEDAIFISASEEQYELCGIAIDQKSLGIFGEISNTQQVRIGCKQRRVNQEAIHAISYNGGFLKLKQITVINGDILVGNGSLTLESVTLENATVISVNDTCEEMSLLAINSSWMNGKMCDMSMGDCAISKLRCKSVDLQITGCLLEASSFKIETTNQIMVHVQDSLFDGVNSRVGALEVSSKSSGSVAVIGCNFSNFVNPLLSEYSMNLYVATVQIRRFRANGELNVTLVNNVFENNERAVTLIGKISSALIEKCRFIGNVAMHSGSAILSLVNSKMVINVYNSTFIENIAGKIRSSFKIKEDDRDIKIVGDTVKMNNSFGTGSIKATGRGGAIRLQQGKMNIRGCWFSKCSANIQAGCIMSDMKTNLMLEDVELHGPDSGDQPAFGAILYSRGTTQLRAVRFVSHQRTTGVSLIDHIGEHWSLTINGINVQCAQGHNLQMHNISALGIDGNGIRTAANRFDELKYECEPCPHGKWSFDAGWVDNQLTTSATSYLSFALGSLKPERIHYNGSYEYHAIDCQPCPSTGLLNDPMGQCSNASQRLQNTPIMVLVFMIALFHML